MIFGPSEMAFEWNFPINIEHNTHHAFIMPVFLCKSISVIFFHLVLGSSSRKMWTTEKAQIDWMWNSRFFVLIIYEHCVHLSLTSTPQKFSARNLDKILIQFYCSSEFHQDVSIFRDIVKLFLKYTWNILCGDLVCTRTSSI